MIKKTVSDCRQKTDDTVAKASDACMTLKTCIDFEAAVIHDSKIMTKYYSVRKIVIIHISLKSKCTESAATHISSLRLSR